MTAAQRLRLVLTLGVINLVLASVALTFGIVGIQSTPETAGGPTPGIAFVSPAPTATTTVPEPTPASSPEPGTSTPGTPVPTTTPAAEPTPTESPAVAPSPSVEPTPGLALTPPAGGPSVVVFGHPPVTEPAATPTPVAVAPETPPPSKHPAKPAKAKHQDKKPHKAHHVPHSGRPDHGQQATVDKSNRGHKSGRRLRVRRRPR